MAKGVELPVNVLVIIVIAVLVLIALATLVASGILSLTPVQVMLEKNSACAKYACGQGTLDPDVNVNLGKDANGVAYDHKLSGLCAYEKRCPGVDLKTYCGCL